MNYRDAIEAYEPANEQEASDKRVILGFMESQPGTLLTRENQIAHITSSGLILNRALDKMLMVHHNIYNTWAWTGGHADGNPDLLEVALKEGKEETGVKNLVPLTEQIASIDILPVYGHMKRQAYVSSHLHLNVSYVLIADEKEALSVKKDENSGVAWIKAEALDTFSNEPYMITVYSKIIQRARRCDVSLGIDKKISKPRWTTKSGGLR